MTVPPGGRILDARERADARAALHAHYRARFGRLDLRGLVPPTGDGTDAPSFDVDDVYQPLEAVEIDGTGAPAPAWHPISMAAGTSLFEPESPRAQAVVRLIASPAPLIELLARPRRRPALVLGGPGAGKTAFLRRCAVHGSADAPLFGVDGAVPVYLPLAITRDAPAVPLIEHAVAALRADGLAIADALIAEAEAGRVVFLLDGLDEVGAAVQAVADAVAALARAFPASRVIATSRPVGLHGVALEVDHLQLEGLADTAIAELFTRWCELDLRRTRGDDAAELGRADGRRLTALVLASPATHDLAASPRGATLVAAAHRAGRELPARRGELHDHALAVLVERWNQARRAGDDGPPALTVDDALALLGPVGLAMVERGRGAIDDATLRALVARAIDAAGIAGIDDADATLAIWRDALGLVVERAPGVVGLAHESLAELFAAHAATAGGALEELLADPARVFSPAWYEVIRWALGALGARDGGEPRLALAIDALVGEARAARARPSPLVPELLGSILVDDPGLTPPLADAICAELVPAWWFDGTPAFDGEHAGTALAQRILGGPWARPLAIALNQRYRDGWGELEGAGMRGRIGPLGLLRRLGASQPLLLCEALVAAMARGATPPPGPPRYMPLLTIPLPADDPGSHLRFSMRVSGLAVLLREGAGGLFFAALPGHADPDPSWIVLEDGAGTRLLGRRLDAPPPETIELTGTIHIAVAEHPDPALLPNVLAAWQELASRYPETGPTPPASVDDAVARYGAIDVN